MEISEGYRVINRFNVDNNDTIISGEMNMIERRKGNQTIQEQWRNLGFFYDINDEEKSWHIIGTKQGLLKFYNLLVDYIKDPQHDEISAHEHYGPYMYLEIMTWEKAYINDHAIQGRMEDLQRLAEIFKSKLSDALVGHHFIIGREYSSDSDYSICVEVMEDGFDPALFDPQLSKT